MPEKGAPLALWWEELGVFLGPFWCFHHYKVGYSKHDISKSLIFHSLLIFMIS